MFHKYQHVERFGTTEVKDIEKGTCFIFPKLDGTNSSIWLENEELQFGSRKRHLNGGADNGGFMKWASEQENIKLFFTKNPDLRLYGEWLKPHTFRGYEDTAWLDFYVFDVVDEDGRYLSYDEYLPLLEEFSITVIPPIGIIENPTLEELDKLVDTNKYLVTDEHEHGEGIVIKRYDYVNQYGRVTWAKVVAKEFKQMHGKNRKGKVNVQEGKVLEETISQKYVTESLVEKEFAKIENDTDGWSSKYIPRLLNVIYYSVVSEETWNFVKANRDPTINFKLLKSYVSKQVKEIKPNLF